jgi:hypothetical protein
VIAKEVRDLIQAMWQANPTWGSPRILGEMRKLGIEVAKSTIEMYRVRPSKWRTHLALAMDCPEPRPILAAGQGRIGAMPEGGDLHHHYERVAA